MLSSTGALALSAVPKKLIIVGAGVIGLELGSVYQRLGTEIEVVEMLDRVTPTMDLEVSKELLKIFTKQGMKFHLSTGVKSGKVSEQVTLSLGNEEISGDAVLVSIGRRPYLEGLGIEKVGIKKDKRGGVAVDTSFRTACPNVFAIGDLIDGPMLAHKASDEGIAVVDLICGDEVKINYLAIPNVMYTWPEVAAVGFTSEQAKESGIETIVGKFPFKANSRARCSGDTDGFAKVIGDKASGRVIGIHIIGPAASEMIGEGVVAIEKKMTIKELGLASHAHPTCSEVIKEAALDCFKQAIHI